MTVAYKTTIAFSLVSVPINMYMATQDNDIPFNQLHELDEKKTRYKKICEYCGREIENRDIARDYDCDDDRYVNLSNDNLERIKAIQILHFANLNQISPVYFDKSYYAIPETRWRESF